MKSGCPNSQGGTYSAFRRRTDFALPLPQDISVIPVPVVHSEYGSKNMLATQYPGELRVVSIPVQQQSQPSPASTGFQHRIPRDSACSSGHSWLQMNRDADFYSSAHVSAQDSSYFETSANKRSVRHPDSGQQWECSKQSFNRHFLKGSNLNIDTDTGLQRRQFLNSASSPINNSTALQGDNPVVGSQAYHLQDQCFSVTECKQQKTYPLLMSLLTGRCSYSKSFTTLSPLSQETANIELNTTTIFSDQRGLGVKSPPGALNCGPTRSQNLDHSEGTIFNPHLQQVSSRLLSCQLSKDRVSLVGEMEGLTDGQILDIIEKKLAHFRAILVNRYFSNQLDRDSTLQSDRNMLNVNSVAYLPTAPYCAVTEQCTAAQVGQPLEEDSSMGSKANAELIPTPKEDDCATSTETSERHSPEYPQNMVNVAATHTKKEDESQVVPGMTQNRQAENNHNLEVYGSSLQKEYRAFLLSINPDLEDEDHAPDDSLDLKHTTEMDKGPVCQKTVEPVGLDSVQGMTDVSEDLQTKSSPVVSENKTLKHALLNENQNANPKNQQENQSEWLSNQTSRLCSPTNLSTALSEKVKEHSQYEDISGDESQPATKLSNTKHEELSLSAYSENPKYEDISEDESPQSPFGGYGHVQGQAPTSTETILDEELTPNKQVSPVTETFDLAGFGSESGFEGLLSSKGDSERHIIHSVSCSPSSDLKDEYETDDQIDDDFLVIPIFVSDLKFEPLDEDHDSPEEIVSDVWETGDKDKQHGTSPTQCPAPKPVPASAFTPMEEFDTMTTFLENYTKRSEVATRSSTTTEHEIDSESELHTSQKRRDSLDSCETEDSCDYSPSSAPTNNSLTVSKKMLMKGLHPLPSETEDSESEKEIEDNEVINMQKGQTLHKRRMLIKSKATSQHVQAKTNEQNMSKIDDIIIIDFYDDSGSGDCMDAPCSQQYRCSPETVDSRIGTEERFEKKDQDMDIILISDTEDKYQNYKKPKRKREKKRWSPETLDSEYRTTKEELQGTRLSSADSSQPWHQSTCHDRHYKEVMQDACSDLSNSMEKSQQLIEAKRDSEHVPHKANRKTTLKRRVTFHDDIVVKKSSFSKKKAWKRILPSSESEDSGDDSFDTKNSLCGTSNERLQNNRLSSEDSPERQSYSVGNEADSPSGPIPMIPRLVVVKPSQPHQNLKLLKEANVYRQGKDGSLTRKTTLASSKKTDSGEKTILHMNKNNQGQSKPKPANDRLYATKTNIQAKVPKPRTVSRQLSSPRHECPDTSLSTLSSTDGQLYETRQSSASSQDLSQSGETFTSCSPPKSKQSTSVPRQQMVSSKLVQSHSYSNPSTLNHPTTRSLSSSAATQSSAREPKSKVYEDWANCYFPTRRDRKTSQDDFSTRNDSRRETRPGPSHQDKAPRLMRHESVPPLMKKAKMFAIQRTKDINRDASREQRHSVGAGYKWKTEKSTGKVSKRLRGCEEDWSLPEPPESP